MNPSAFSANFSSVTMPYSMKIFRSSHLPSKSARAVLKSSLQLVGHLTGDVARYLAHVAVALKVAARHVQRNVRRIDNPVQQRQELGNDALHRIGHIHLIAVKLYPVLLNLEIVVDFREIENPRQVERIVDVEMYPEQRVVAARIELPVEFPVLFVGHIGRIMRPERVGIVHDVVPFGIHILSVLPLLYLSAGYRYGKEAAVFTQHSANTGLVGELGALFAQIEDDIGSPRPFFSARSVMVNSGVPPQLHTTVGASSL